MLMGYQHASLAAGRWQEFSLAEQMGNIGSEVSRAAGWRGKNQERFMSAMERALELMDLTLEDERWRGRRKELARAREALGDALLGGTEYGESPQGLAKYFFDFALAARANR